MDIPLPHDSVASPQLTVCVATHCRPRLLALTLRSVLEQTFRDFEVYVSDNASDPETEAVVRSFNDPRVQYSPDREAIGMIAHLNRCLRLGTAPLITIVQDDDVLDPDSLELKLAMLKQHPRAAFVHSGIRYIRDDDSILLEHVDWTGFSRERVDRSDIFLDRVLRTGNEVCFSTVVMRRTVAGTLMFDEADGEACDFGFWVRASMLGDVGFLPQRLTSMRVHANSISSRAVQEHGDVVPTSSLRLIALTRDVKLRFAATAAPPHKVQLYRRLAFRAAREQLCIWILRGAPNPIELFGRARLAFRTEPSLWWFPRTAVDTLAAVARYVRRLSSSD